MPAHRNLRAELDGAECLHVMMLHTEYGNAFGAVYFGAWFRKEMKRLGLGGLQPHGLRKNAVCALLEAGCSEAETAAITGQSLRMVMHYAQKVNQKRASPHRRWQNGRRTVDARRVANPPAESGKPDRKTMVPPRGIEPLFSG